MKKPKPPGPAANARHLLDTSTLLWALSTPERLSRRARDLVTAGVNVVSVASYWEVVVKTRKGLLSIADLPEWWQRATDTVRADVLPIRAAHVSAMVALPALHTDPFDRMLMAQAIAEGLTLVTNDARVKSYPVPTVW